MRYPRSLWFGKISYGETTVRLFADTQKTNKAVILEGEPLSGDDCVLLTYNYAKAQGLSVGDSITLAGSGFVISGLCLKPDYAAMYADFEDSFPKQRRFRYRADNRKHNGIPCAFRAEAEKDRHGGMPQGRAGIAF